MASVYFLDDKYQKHGPVELDELPSLGLTPDTPVWLPGLKEWTPAKSVPAVAAVLFKPEPAPQPVQLAPQPAVSAPQPVQPAPQPAVSAPRPVQPAPQPAVTAPQPVQPAPQPAVSAPQPVQPAPQPSVSAPQPVQPAPQPAQLTLRDTQPQPVSYSDTPDSEYAYDAAQSERGNTPGAVGLVCALLCLVSWIPVAGFLVTWLVALIFSLVGLGKRQKGMAIGGLIVCVIFLILFVLGMFVFDRALRSVTRGFDIF